MRALFCWLLLVSSGGVGACSQANSSGPKEPNIPAVRVNQVGIAERAQMTQREDPGSGEEQAMPAPEEQVTLRQVPAADSAALSAKVPPQTPDSDLGAALRDDRKEGMLAREQERMRGAQ